MPLRLRLLPSPFSDATPGDLRGLTEERAIEIPDDTGEVRIGRRPDLELPLPYRALSALHARLVRVDERWQIEDLGSTNGTRVDGERLTAHQPRAISPGSQITLGQITFAFDGPVGAVVGSEGTATIARRLVSDLFAASPDMATPTVAITAGEGRDLRSPARVRRDLSRARRDRQTVGRRRRQGPRLQERRTGERRADHGSTPPARR
jgi:pSer/pThr/pTyr-binding forkhead associated (FHA) protein